MEPVAHAAYVMIAATAVLAVFFGAVGGAIAWAFKIRLAWGALLTAGAYLTHAVLFGPIRLGAAAFIGLPPLVLALLTSELAARWLETRARLWRIGTALAALGCGLVPGFPCLLTGRVNLRAPSHVALAADACLLVLVYLGWRSSFQAR